LTFRVFLSISTHVVLNNLAHPNQQTSLLARSPPASHTAVMASQVPAAHLQGSLTILNLSTTSAHGLRGLSSGPLKEFNLSEFLQIVFNAPRTPASREISPSGAYVERNNHHEPRKDAPLTNGDHQLSNSHCPSNVYVQLALRSCRSTKSTDFISIDQATAVVDERSASTREALGLPTSEASDTDSSRSSYTRTSTSQIGSDSTVPSEEESCGQENSSDT
jgi:hypothetical protein